MENQNGMQVAQSDLSFLDEQLRYKLNVAGPAVREVWESARGLQNLQNSIRETQTRLNEHKPLSGWKKFGIGFLIVWLADTVFSILLLATLGRFLPIFTSGAVLSFTGTALGIPIAIILVKKISAGNDQKKYALEQYMQELYQQIPAAQAVVRDAYDKNYQAISFIPQAYLSPEAVNFFHDVVANGRAESMKEAINLFEEYLHRRRMEQGQQQIMEQQAIIQQGVEEAIAAARSAESSANWAAYMSTRY